MLSAVIVAISGRDWQRQHPQRGDGKAFIEGTIYGGVVGLREQITDGRHQGPIISGCSSTTRGLKGEERGQHREGVLGMGGSGGLPTGQVLRPQPEDCREKE